MYKKQPLLQKSSIRPVWTLWWTPENSIKIIIIRPRIEFPFLSISVSGQQFVAHSPQIPAGHPVCATCCNRNVPHSACGATAGAIYSRAVLFSLFCFCSVLCSCFVVASPSLTSTCFFYFWYFFGSLFFLSCLAPDAFFFVLPPLPVPLLLPMILLVLLLLSASYFYPFLLVFFWYLALLLVQLMPFVVAFGLFFGAVFVATPWRVPVLCSR